jgi:signal transduction histidine kinase
MALACMSAGVLQLVVFYVTPIVSRRVFSGWPRGWLLHLVAFLAAFVGGIGPGLTAEAVAIAAIWWKGVYFTPMHPGLEVFALIGLLQIFVIHQLQLAQRAAIGREAALEAARQRADGARRAAQEANRLKDQFLATLSHEMRTPLTVILGYCGLARVHGIQPDRHRIVMATIERQAVAQLGIVEDLFEVQRLLHDDVRLDRGTVDLEAAAAQVLTALRDLAEQKRITVVLDVVPLTIEGDAASIRQVQRKLLANALKFSPEGARVLLAIGGSDDHAVIVVENTGDTIPVDFLPHVFEPFRQGDMSSTRVHGGLGLGLAIVKRLVDLQNGSIDVHSDGGRTRFTVRLPQRRPSPNR